MIFVADAVNSIIQGLMSTIMVNYCVEKRLKKNKATIIVTSLCIWLCIQISFILIGNTSLNIVMSYILPLIIIIVVYRKNMISSIISFNLIYLIFSISSLITPNIFFLFIKSELPKQYIEVGEFICVYIPQYILAVLMFVKIHSLYNIYRWIITKSYSMIILVLVTIILDVIGIFDLVYYNNDTPILKNILFGFFALLLIVIIIYFSNLENQMKDTQMLNAALEEKIQELKKVKHDYGAQISYIYGLHLMNRHERSAELLKDIMDGNNSIMEAVCVGAENDSIINSVAKDIVSKGIHLIIDEQADLEQINISKIELQIVVFNIIHNSVATMDGKGILNIRTYYGINTIIIKIQNNGPKIENDMIDKIFEPGYSIDDERLGLALAKEIIERNKGEIFVISDINSTEFKISLPIKADC